MENRTSSVGEETLEVFGPLRFMFKEFQNEEPTYSFAEAVAEILQKCRSGEIGMDGDEMEAMIETCVDFANDLKLHKEPMTLLSGAEIASLAFYTAEFFGCESMYSVLNSLLRKRDRQGVKPFIKYIWLVMHAMKKCPQYDGRLVYRGVRGLDLRQQYTKGREITWHQFSSCTCDIEVEQRFLGESGPRTLFNIELTSNRGRLVSKFSLMESEQEVLLPPNTRFKVVNTLTQSELTIVQLKELESKDPILIFDGECPSPRPSPIPPDPLPYEMGLQTWFISLGITTMQAAAYEAKLINANIGTIERLKRHLERKPDLLSTLDFDSFDVEDIHAALKIQPAPNPTPKPEPVIEEEETLLAWLVGIDIVSIRAKKYAAQLVNAGIGSVEKLKRRLERSNNLLQSLSFDDFDVEEIFTALEIHCPPSTPIPLPPTPAPAPPPAPFPSPGSQATETIVRFDVAAAQSKSFKFSRNNTQAVCPNGPSTVFSSASATPTTKISWTFRVSGNDSWSTGVVPSRIPANAQDSYLHASGTIGVKNSGTLGGSLPSISVHESLIYFSLDGSTRKAVMTVNGMDERTWVLAPADLPARLAICGFHGTVVELLDVLSTDPSPTPQPSPRPTPAPAPTAHLGEWRNPSSGKIKHYCALNADSMVGSMFRCVHSGGVITGSHWSCCGARDATAAVCSVAATISSQPGTAVKVHPGEWRHGSEFRFHCALDLGSMLDASKHLCSHGGGVIPTSHWSCCGARSASTPGCQNQMISQTKSKQHSHALQPVPLARRLTARCDVCRKSGSCAYHCLPCDWDICDSCLLAESAVTETSHVGKMHCHCGHNLGLVSPPLEKSYFHLKDACRWVCCGASWETTTCSPSISGAPSSSSSNRTSHVGEFRSGPPFKYHCALDEDSMDDGSTHKCIHPGGIILTSHWSCCGATEASATGCNIKASATSKRHNHALAPVPTGRKLSAYCDCCRIRGSCAYYCSNCDWDICADCLQGESVPQVSPAGTSAGRRHHGEWRDSERAIYHCAVDEDSMAGSTHKCKHPGGIIVSSHWSCCGSRSFTAPGCTQTVGGGGNRHELSPTKESSQKCTKCGFFGPSSQTTNMFCSKCGTCGICCGKAGTSCS